MLLTELICTLGVGFLAPERCIPQTLRLMNSSCDKHEQEVPAEIMREPIMTTRAAGQSGTGIEQPCKAVVSPRLGDIQ